MNNVLGACCYRSRISVKPRIRHAVLASSTRRPLFSFLGCNGENNINTSKVEAENASKAKLQQEEATRILLDGVRHRISIQHAHPLGPWQAMLELVQGHYNRWEAAKKVSATTVDVLGVILPIATATPVFRVLDLASGSRGEPGTTVAHALPLAAVHCTDSCSIAVAAIPIQVLVDGASTTSIGKKEKIHASAHCCPLLPPPPKNLTKSVTDLTDLSSYESNTFDAIICCYGYTLSSDISRALTEAYRVLVPGGVLVTATWERSAMLSIGRDVVATVRGGGRDPYHGHDDDEAFLPPRLVPLNKLALSGVGELEALLVASGFDQPKAVVASSLVYPIDLGGTPADQFATGTILARDELESLGALGPDNSGEVGAGGWGNLAEEAFWINIKKYADVVDGNMFLKDNAFKLTVSTKKTCVLQ